MYSMIIGIDNGVTGTIAILSLKYQHFGKIKTTVGQDYTKKKQNISRVDSRWMFDLISGARVDAGVQSNEVFILMERPLKNPGMFQASISGARAFEAELIVIERLSAGWQCVDSKEWQRIMLPTGCEKDQLKPASRDIGIRLFPQFTDAIQKHGDADSLLMAEWWRRKTGVSL